MTATGKAAGNSSAAINSSARPLDKNAEARRKKAEAKKRKQALKDERRQQTSPLYNPKAMYALGGKLAYAGTIVILLASLLGIVMGYSPFSLENVLLWAAIIAMMFFFETHRDSKVAPAALIIFSLISIFLIDGDVPKLLMLVSLVGSILTVIGFSILVAPEKTRLLFREIVRHKSVYILLLVPFIYYVIFKYIPIWNAQIAFKDYMAVDGVLGSKFIGLDNFKDFINSFYFWSLIRNTLMYSFGKLIISLPLSIILSIAIYECTRPHLRKVVQTLAYLPHFLSWVIMYGVLQALLGPADGIFNDIIKMFGGQPIDFLSNTSAFPWVVLLSDAWKEMGWSAIIFIAALMGIDVSLFEAAMVEGANSWQRIRYITFPAIAPVIATVLLLKIGTILDAGFNQIYMLYSPQVYSVADIIDTWVYRQGLLEFNFGLATAVGLFKGVIGMCLVFISNKLVEKFNEGSSLF